MTGEKRPTPTVEEYLETMLHLASEGKPIIAARLAERFHVSPPTVTATLRRMTRDGLIRTDRRKGIRLTEDGLRAANNLVRRHRLAERLLTDVLKIPWHQVHQEACAMEHGISDRVMESLYHALERPTTCPHGNPIPMGNTLLPVRGVPLDTIPAGTAVRVERISEDATDLPELLEYLEQGSIRPGASLLVQEVAPYAGTIKVRQENGEFSIGSKAASSVWVTPVAVDQPPAPGR